MMSSRAVEASRFKPQFRCGTPTAIAELKTRANTARPDTRQPA
jgi:hypothetical protein